MATQSQTRPASWPTSSAGRWLAWITASGVGGLIGQILVGLAGLVLGLFLPTITVTPTNDLSNLFLLIWLLMFVSLGIAVWLPLALGQSLVLRRVIPGFDRRAMMRWLLLSVVGGGGGLVLGVIAFSVLMAASIGRARPAGDDWRLVLYLCVAGIVGGSVLGQSQRTLIRRYLPTSGWWVGANVLAWGGAVPLSSVLLAGGVPPLLATAFAASGLGTLAGLSIGNALAGTLVILLAAPVTGLALLRMRPEPRESSI